MITPNDIAVLAKIFFDIQITLNILHWQTDSYSIHKSSEQLQDRLRDVIDRFIKVLQGTCGCKLRFISPGQIIIDNHSKQSTLQKLKEFKKFITTNEKLLYIMEKHSELKAIRDEMSEATDRTFYTFTLA